MLKKGYYMSIFHLRGGDGKGGGGGLLKML